MHRAARRTNTPLQALVTLNDPQFVEAARHLAEMTLKRVARRARRGWIIWRRLLARPLRPEEAEVAAVSLEKLLDHYRALRAAKQLLAYGESPADGAIEAAELAGWWTMLANQLMNLDEVLNK